MSFFYGVVGFLGFEGLRIYKCLWARRPIAPASKIWWYVIVVAALGAFSGVVAEAVSPGRGLGAIYAGFSVPCGLKALLEPVNGKRGARGVEVSDDIVVESPGFFSYLRFIYFE